MIIIKLMELSKNTIIVTAAWWWRKKIPWWWRQRLSQWIKPFHEPTRAEQCQRKICRVNHMAFLKTCILIRKNERHILLSFFNYFIYILLLSKTRRQVVILVLENVPFHTLCISNVYKNNSLSCLRCEKKSSCNDTVTWLQFSWSELMTFPYFRFSLLFLKWRHFLNTFHPNFGL